MSILSKTNNENNAPFFHEFKKQASFFLKEKIKTARLALTDVTPAQLWTEEATSGNPWSPDTRTLGSISRAAFELDDYTRIVEILHKRLNKFERKNWRVSYNSLIVLEHLLTHGPESVSDEFQGDKDVIREMESFQYIDEKGFNWGLAVRKKSERILKLLQKGPLLKEERDRARKLSRGIQGFGSFCQRSSSTQGVLRETPIVKYGRSNSEFHSHESQENQLLSSNEENLTFKSENSSQSQGKLNLTVESRTQTENLISLGSFDNHQVAEKTEIHFKNLAPKKEEIHRWNCIGESNPLLEEKNIETSNGNSTEDDSHPFNETGYQTSASLLSAS